MIKILVVDDLTDNVRLLTLALGDYGYKVAGARSGPEALELAAIERPDAVILDVMMPEMSGIEVCRYLKADPETAPIPVIMVTAKDRDRDVIDGLDAGADDYVTKPFNPRILLARLEAVLRAKKAHDALKRANARLHAANELLDKKNERLSKLYNTAQQFVDNVSHEFRTPLTVIKDYVSLVGEGMVGEVNDEQRQMLDVACVRADDLNTMVDDMLDVSKIESGLLGAWRKDCHIADVIQNVRIALDKKAAVEGISFDVVVEDDLPEVFCDAEEVGRVINNLVANAMKFCGNPGVVQLRAKADAASQGIVVEVTDDGPGIDKEGLSAIFERFRQLDTQIRSSTKGFGLGLSIAKELVELNFGTMDVQSEVGRGSTFRFTVPPAQPGEVVRRYLGQIEHMPNGSPVVSLVLAQVDESVDVEVANGLDGFLNCVLRRNDLLFRVDPRKWLLVVPTPEIELDTFLARVGDELRQAQRNCPGVPLPELSLNVENTWRVAGLADEILDRFDAIVPPQITDPVAAGCGATEE